MTNEDRPDTICGLTLYQCQVCHEFGKLKEHIEILVTEGYKNPSVICKPCKSRILGKSDE